MILENIWKLRTDPFYPEVDKDGAPIEKGAFDRSLDPLVDAKVLPLYFDVYDWSFSPLFRNLFDQNASDAFPTQRTLASDPPLTIIISGSRQTGLDSMANLVLHKIKLTSGQPLLVCDLELEGRDQVRNVAAVASHIITDIEFAKPPVPDADKLVARMRTQYERVRKEQEGQKEATYSELFRILGRILTDLKRTLVVKITKGGDNDSWVRIQDLVGRCCSYVLIMTPDLPYAKTTYDTLTTQGRNVSWIQALPLEEEKARKYIATRLAAERLATAKFRAHQALLPFTDEAIAALYEPGAAGAHIGTVKHPVGWLRRTLYQAIKDQVDAVKEKHPNADQHTLAAIDPETTRINASQMKGARDKLNLGR